MFVKSIHLPVEQIALVLSSSRDFAWIDSADGEGVSILAFDAIETRSFGPDDGPQFLNFLSSFRLVSRFTLHASLPPSLWLSYTSYEAYQFNPLIPVKPTHQKKYPLAVFRRYDTYIKIDRSKNEKWFVSGSSRAEEKWAQFYSIPVNRKPFTESCALRSSVLGQRSTVNGQPPISTTSIPEYNAAISSIKDALLRGDYYELNYTIEFEGRFDAVGTACRAPTLDLYLRLRDIARAPMMAFFDWPEIKILSASPERFFRTEGGVIKTHPIKGTIKRGTTEAEDEQNKKTLLSSEKDRAELLMVTDMLRNDLGRICEIGSVRTDPVFGLHTFSHYHHLISDITGRLKKDVTLADVFCALFPGGSITGAPKIAVMKHVDELEQRARGIYTGAVGYATDAGLVDFNIPIRTITIKGESLSFAVGGGIVADSTAEKEHEECLVKARGMLAALGCGGPLRP